MTAKRWWILGVVLLVLAAGIAAGTLLDRVTAGPDDLAELRDVFEVIALVRTHYVDPVDTTELVKAYLQKGTINGMLSALDDDYTRYMDRRAFEQMRIETSGTYSGIGIYVGMRDQRLTIIAPIEGTPGWEADLQAGDRILSIDGRPTDNMSQAEAVSLLRGEAGQPVRMEIERERGGQQIRRTVEVVRAVIEVPAVTKSAMLENGIGYVRLAHFTERTDEQLTEAVNRLRRQGLAALILDLRNNPGGLLSAAIDVADRFLAEGPILHVVGRGNDRRTIEARPEGTWPRLPMVVLVNGGSASASEIVSGALQDRGAAKLVGTTTFGKGLVQTILPLRGGAALSVTTARYLTAGGRSIDKSGITPDYVVEVPEKTEEETAREMERALRGELDRNDPQLQKAIEVLRGELARETWKQAS